jgi:uncharacterized coiled-coil protein SlyX
MSIRIQFTFEDDIKTLLDRLSKERGVSPSALMATLIAQAESPSRTAVAHGNEGIALDVVTRRIEQLQEQLDIQQDMDGRRIADLTPRLSELEVEVARLRETFAYALERLEVLAGMALRPGVQYRPDPAASPKRAWWQWGTS